MTAVRVSGQQIWPRLFLLARNTDWQIRVVITDTTGLQSLPAIIDVTVLAVTP